ncbi:MAG TPA: hypothetical protein VN969_09180 [Streptosporangiaceae bacterium]|nr:hypothetical protein [Streptosporangiaceae bacterium]
MSRLARLGLRTVPDEPDQVVRLRGFRKEHPGVSIYTGLGYWQALIPQPNGETIVTRYLLEELLDKLDALLSPPEKRGESAGEKETTP